MNQKQAAGLSAPRSGLGPVSPALLFAAATLALAVLLLSDEIRTNLVDGWQDPDSLFRIMQIRAYLDGQGWYDVTAHRMAPPDGVVMHWSRLVDLPIALLVRLVEPVVGRTTAELVAMNLWPPVLFAAFTAGLAAIARRFTGWPGAFWALFLLVQSPSITGLFAPARVDHHNVQAVLVAWLVAGLVRADRGFAPAALAGAMAGLSLAVGMEMLLVVAVTAAGLALAWAVDGDRWRTALAGFGLAFAGTVAATFLATVPPDRWFVAACDALSLFYLAASVVGGLGVAALAMVVGRGPATGRADVVVRGSALCGLAALVLAVAALIEPACLAGPYAELDPRLGPIWLDHVSETSSLWQYVMDKTWLVPVHYGAPFTAVVVGILLHRRVAPADRAAFTMLLSLVAVSMLVGTVQVRGLVPAQTLGAAVGGVLIVESRRAADAVSGLGNLVRRFVWLPMSPLALYFLFLPFADPAQQAAEDREFADVDTCFSELGAALDREPPGLVVAPSNLGAFILYRSAADTILSAPYHRNAGGILTAEAILAGPEPFATLDAVGADYVALCRKDSELELMAERAPKGLAAQLDGGVRPQRLEPLVETPATLVFRVLRPAAGTDPAITGSVEPLRLRPALE